MNEMQRIFSVSPDIERWLEKQTFEVEKTELFYVEVAMGKELYEACYYLKSFPDTYMKIRVDSEAKEVKAEVTEAQYKLARSQRIGKKVVKKTYRLEIERQKFVVMKYLKNLKGLYILVAHAIEGKSTGESEALHSLQPLMLKVINQDEKYSDKSLALCTPVMEYSMNKLFDKIDAYEPANLFFWQVPKRIYVRDGVALVLYRNLRLLHHYRANYQHKHFSASLHRLRVIMRRSATLLETFSSFFDPNIHRVCINMLLHYHEETKLLRYLYYLDELYETNKDAKPNLQQELKDLIYQEHRAVSQMFHDQPFQQLVQILTREVQDSDKHPCSSLEDEVMKVVRERLSALEALFKQTNEGYDEETLESLYTAIDSLQTLIEDFFHIIGEKNTKIIVEELNILLKPLREYRNCKERGEILEAMKKQARQDIDIRPLLCTHIQELEEKIAHALRLLRASRFYV